MMLESTSNVHFVSLIGLICIVQTVAQLCPYVDKACTKCNGYIVYCNNLTEIPRLNTGSNVYPVQEVSFRDGTINSIPEDTLPPRLSIIYMHGLPLKNISEDAFDTSATTLRILHFVNAQFNRLPEALKKLTKLVSLSIENTRINYWNISLLNQIAQSVVTLELMNVSLYSWPSWISNFKRLHTLDLSGNSFFCIPDDAFSSVSDSLRVLHLSGTGLTHVPHVLSTLPRLVVLNLDNNRIQKIPPGSLPASLSNLYLSYNKFSSIPDDIAGLSKLIVLRITHNMISSIRPNSFPSTMQHLKLDANKITEIKNTTFSNLKHLYLLQLERNPISQISPDAFSDLVSLNFFNIGSQLAEIPLAFTKLRPPVNIIFGTTKELSCPCPTPQKLIDWFNSGIQLKKDWFNPAIKVKLFPQICSNGKPVYSYLEGKCE